ncbi:unnamed protein product [Calypogeia fissa]
MASAGTVLSLEFVGRGSTTVVAQACVSTAGDVAKCRILPAKCCSVIASVVRLDSTGKQRPLERRATGFSRICSSATGNGAMSWNSASGSPGVDVEKYRSRLEALLYCGKEIPEEKIDKPTGVPAKSLPIGNKPMCSSCQAKGAVWCPTCTGSGLYVDSILESQGIIVKVKCLGCGGTGSTMCPKCGGRGHAEI